MWQYLAAMGTLGIAWFGTLEVPPAWLNTVRMAFGVAFAVLAMAGYLTLQQLIRLRGAWMESARAMNQIKDFYADRLDLAPAFLWRTTTLPKAGKKDSVAFLLALAVMVMDAFALVLAFSFFGLAINEARGPWAGMGVGVLAAVLAVIWQLRLYQSWEVASSTKYAEILSPFLTRGARRAIIRSPLLHYLCRNHHCCGAGVALLRHRRYRPLNHNFRATRKIQWLFVPSFRLITPSYGKSRRKSSGSAKPCRT